MRGWEGDSEGMHEGATDGMRGWEGDSEGIHEGAIKEVKVTEVGETCKLVGIGKLKVTHASACLCYVVMPIFSFCR